MVTIPPRITKTAADRMATVRRELNAAAKNRPTKIQHNQMIPSCRKPLAIFLLRTTSVALTKSRSSAEYACFSESGLCGIQARLGWPPTNPDVRALSETEQTVRTDTSSEFIDRIVLYAHAIAL